MVRRARVPRGMDNRISSWVPFNHRELSGWPDGIQYSPKQRKKRVRRQRERKRVDPESLPIHRVAVVMIGESL